MTSFSSRTKEGEKPGNWAELPPELTSSILLRLSVIDIFENAQKVCKSWRRVTKDPSMWRKIDMQNTGDRGSLSYKGIICRNAVDRSEGGLVEIKIGNFCTNSLITYIADRSSKLRSLGVAILFPSTSKGLETAVAKLPLLEELEISETWTKLDLKAIGHSCPQLKTLKINCSNYRKMRDDFGVLYDDDNDDALAIAETMPELRHLQLIGNELSDIGLNTILDKCLHLEHLDLRQCLEAMISRDLKKRCLERIKDLRHPDDNIADYPFYITPVYFFPADDDYLA